MNNKEAHGQNKERSLVEGIVLCLIRQGKGSYERV